MENVQRPVHREAKAVVNMTRFIVIFLPFLNSFFCTEVMVMYLYVLLMYIERDNEQIQDHKCLCLSTLMILQFFFPPKRGEHSMLDD